MSRTEQHRRWRRIFSPLLAVLVGSAAASIMLPEPVMAAVITVTTADDNGSDAAPVIGSLRAAILESNARSGELDRIEFSIGAEGSIQRIVPLAPLPVITDPVMIDGWSQGPGEYTGTPLIEVRGNLAGSGATGLTIQASATTVRGLMINGFQGHAIVTSGAGAAVTGCYLGSYEQSVVGNGGAGILATGPNLVIGGATVSSRNIISGNGGGGVRISGAAATGAQVVMNYIGTDVTGTVALGNSQPGIAVIDAPNATIGSAVVSAGNLISGQNGNSAPQGVGVLVSGAGATNTVIAGNLIGTTADGNTRLDNDEGIRIENAPGVTIGGITDYARNVISGNGFAGVRIIGSGADGSRVIGNYIGTRANGSAPNGNGGPGVLINGAPNISVGGPNFAYRNIISGNNSGISVVGSAATGVTIAGNFIGTDASGSNPLLSGNGVMVMDGAHVTVGGEVVGAENKIVGHSLATTTIGVAVTGNSRATIQGNSISGFGGLGIDLGADGVTPNDINDADTGPNGLLNHPVVLSASGTGNHTLVVITLNPLVPAFLSIDVFSSPTCDPSGYGEGAVWLGRQQRNFSQYASQQAVYVAAAPPGHRITATATDPNGNTSEFSRCTTVAMPQLAIQDATIDEQTGAVVLPVIIDRPSAGLVQVNYATSDVTAVGGSSCTVGADYVTTSGTASISPTYLDALIVIPICRDGIDESAERFTVTLSNPSNAELGQAGATITIRAHAALPGCTPRPPIRIQTRLRAGLQVVTLTSSDANPMRELRFGSIQNATVQFEQQVVSGGQTISLGGDPTSVQFLVFRTSPGQPVTVPLTVIDRCGPWSTLVGGGSGAGF